jgi:hypothetical protein
LRRAAATRPPSSRDAGRSDREVSRPARDLRRGGVTAIETTISDIYAAKEIAERIQAANDVEADSWIVTNAQFFTAVKAQETSNTLIRLFVALSVAFGIVAVLVVSVIQRSKDIGILRRQDRGIDEQAALQNQREKLCSVGLARDRVPTDGCARTYSDLKTPSSSECA